MKLEVELEMVTRMELRTKVEGDEGKRQLPEIEQWQ